MTRKSKRKAIGRRKKGYSTYPKSRKENDVEQIAVMDHTYACSQSDILTGDPVDCAEAVPDIDYVQVEPQLENTEILREDPVDCAEAVPDIVYVHVDPQLENTEILREDSAVQESGRETAWKEFILTESSDISKTRNQCMEEKDSDNCPAHQFYVVLHKVFRYCPNDDLDETVPKLKTERLYAHYMSLNAEIQGGKTIIGSLNYGGTGKLGIRFVEHYQHNPMVSVKLCLTISPTLKPKLHVHNKELSSDHDFWTGLTHIYTSVKDVQKLVSKLESWVICVANHENEYVSMVPSGVPIHFSASSTASAYREDICAEREVFTYNSTISSTKCSLLVSNKIRCKHCELYRRSLRKKSFRLKHQKDSTFSLKKTPHKKMNAEKLIKKINIVQTEKKLVQSELERLVSRY